MIIVSSSGVMESERGVCAVPHTGLSDDELRLSLVGLPNGEYATTICRGCGIYTVGSTGSHKTAKIVFQCKVCFESE